MKETKLIKHFEEIYEEILIGFIMELKRQNRSDGRLIGKELAKLTEIMRSWNA